MRKEKSPPKSPLWEKYKKPGSGSYLLMHGRISWQKLTKFGISLANWSIYLCYFLHKVKILTPSCNKWPTHTVIWIRFLFTDTQAHFLSEIDPLPSISAVVSSTSCCFLHKVQILTPSCHKEPSHPAAILSIGFPHRRCKSSIHSMRKEKSPPKIRLWE